MAGRPAILKVDIVADAKGVGRGVDEAESKLGKLGGIGKKVGIAAAAGLAVAGAAAVKMGLDSIGAASDVQQAMGALDTIYGKNSARVKKWADGAADSVGLAKSEYANLSALVGSQLQGMGLATDKATGKSNDLITMGADLAATFGGSVSDAVGAVSSLLKGEADPIERYGVAIKKSDINARLAAEGLDKLEGKALKQATAQTTLTMLTEQTAKAQGAFGRESNTLAGQQERLSAKFTNLKATLGEKLLPIATKVTTWVSEKMLPGAIRLGGELGDKLGPTFALVGRFITTKLVPAAVKLYGWFVDKIVPGIRSYVTPVLDGVRAMFGKVADKIGENEPQLKKILTAFKTVAEFIADKVMPILGKVIGKGFEALGVAIGIVVDAVALLVDWIDKAVGKIGDLVDWIGKIDMPDIDIPFVGGAVGDLLTVRYQLAGDSPNLDSRRAWTSAALTPATWSSMSSQASTLAGQITVDARTFLEIDNRASLADELTLARKLEDVLARHSQRMGRQLVTP